MQVLFAMSKNLLSVAEGYRTNSQKIPSRNPIQEGIVSVFSYYRYK